MKKVFTFLSFLLIISMVGCSSGSATVSDELRAELDGYKKEIEAQKKEIASLKKSLAGADTKKIESEVAAVKNDVNTNKTDIRLTRSALKSLQNSLEEMQSASPLIDTTSRILLDDIQLLKSQLKELNSKITDQPRVAVTSAPQKPETKLPAAAAQPAGTRLSPSEYRAEYVNTLGKFQNGQYAQARAEFQDLVRNNPADDLADNAQYWVGECYYAEKKYEEAILAFEKVFTFADRGKFDDAQFKLGLCYRKLGRTEKARDEFERLVNYYEDSEWREQAQNILKKLR